MKGEWSVLTIDIEKNYIARDIIRERERETEREKVKKRTSLAIVVLNL